MMNKKHNGSILGFLFVILLLFLVACSQSVSTVPTNQPIDVENQEGINSEVALMPVIDIINVDDEGNTDINQDALQSGLSGLGNLNEEEINGLLYMREEEKLAHDIYITLYEIWGLPIFNNIAGSEQTHTDAVLILLNVFGLTDPVTGNDVGEFVDPDLQALYDQLVAQGTQSLSDALKVGAAIEEIDILDLEKYLAQTDNPDIRLVYENLLKGSRNHLRSFTSTLNRQTGEIYQVQYLSNDVYQSILDSAIESGVNGDGNHQ